MSTAEPTSPSRLRSRLQDARGEAILQRSVELQQHYNNTGVAAQTIEEGANAALASLLTMSGCPAVNLHGTAEEVDKQLAEIGAFCRDLMPVAKYLTAYPTLQAIAQRTDEAAFEEFKAAATKYTDETPFDVSAEKDGRTLLSWTMNESIAKWLLENEGVRASIAASGLTLAWLFGNNAPAPVIKAALEAGSIVSSDTVTYYNESALSLAIQGSAYDDELFSLLLAKCGKDEIDWVRPNFGCSMIDTAVRTANYSKAKLLADRGADLFRGIWGNSAFITLATTNSDLAFITSILEVPTSKKSVLEELSFSLTAQTAPSCTADFLQALKDIGADPHAETLEACTAKGQPYPLSQFIMYSNVASVRKLIEFGAGVTGKVDAAGNAALHLASGEEILDMLIAAGADAKAVNDAGNTPVMVQMMNGNVVNALKLLPLSDVGTVNAAGQTLLHLAVNAGVTVVNALFEVEGAHLTIDVKDGAGNTPLHAAAAANNADVMSVLIERGADVNAVTAEGKTALMLSASNAAGVALLLTKPHNLAVKDNQGRTALWYCANAGSVESINTLLLDQGATIDEKDNDGVSVLLAYLTGSVTLDVDLFKRLVDGTPDLTAGRTSDKYSPVLALVDTRYYQDGFSACAEYVLEKKIALHSIADATGTLLAHVARVVNYSDVLSQLGLAAFEDAKANGVDAHEYVTREFGDSSAVSFLATRGGSVDDSFNQLFKAILDAVPSAVEAILSIDGRTPLMQAVAGNNPGGLQLLLERNANVHVVDKKGLNALHVCSSVDYARPLLEKGCRIISDKVNAFLLTDEMVALLGDQLDGLTATNSLLMLAITSSIDDSLMNRTVLAGLAAKTINGTEEVDVQTAIHWLSYAGNNIGDNQSLWLEKVLAAGGDVNLVRSDNVTPLTEALRGSNRGALQLLLDHPNIEVNKIVAGETPLTYAVTNGRAQDMVELLLAKGANKATPNEAGKFAHELTADEAIKALLAL